MDLLMSSTLSTPAGVSVPGESLSGRMVALYFGAAWCPACRQFTKLLKKLFIDLARRKGSAENFRVVYVGSDRNEAERADFVTEHGDWLLLPHEDPVIEELHDLYDITMVPKLVILAPTGDLITSTGRKELQDRGMAAFRIWTDASAGLGAPLSSIPPSLAPSRSDLLDPLTRSPTPGGRLTPAGRMSTPANRLTPLQS